MCFVPRRELLLWYCLNDTPNFYRFVEAPADFLEYFSHLFGLYIDRLAHRLPIFVRTLVAWAGNLILCVGVEAWHI